MAAHRLRQLPGFLGSQACGEGLGLGQVSGSLGLQRSDDRAALAQLLTQLFENDTEIPCMSKNDRTVKPTDIKRFISFNPHTAATE
jgi:hypothetical protein